MCVCVFFPPLGVSIFPEVFLVCLWGGRFFEVFFCCLVCTYVCTYDIGEVFFNCWVSYRGCRGFFRSGIFAEFLFFVAVVLRVEVLLSLLLLLLDIDTF